jgi:phosphoglycolate phosphatase
MECNLCGSATFVDMNTRKAVRCNECGSLERTRLLWLYLENGRIHENAKVLHLAPEKGLYDTLSKRLAPGNYVTADIDPSRYRFAKDCVKLDLCELDDQPSGEYDLIIHSHVLEHVPCNVAYTLFHLHRMLKDDGRHICVIPFMAGKYDECFQDIGNEERQRRFGQFDHVRRFGKEDMGSHLGKLLNLPEEFNALDTFSEETLRAANIPENHWRGFHIGTVLYLRKTDRTLLAWQEN